MGRDNLSLLAQLQAANDIDAFVDIPSDTLLHRLQADILELHDSTTTGTDLLHHWQDSQHKRVLAADDRSLTLHACHSPQREVEVLYDHLLALLDKNHHAYLATLKPRDIIVMVPDIDTYTPYIQAVFGNAPPDRFLPFAISDRRTKASHPILHAFLTLLTLPHSRFTVEEILALLDVKALANRFEIDEEGLKTLRVWIEAAGIRWGLDDETLSDLSLPVTGKNTWQFGLTRLLLGYAMESDHGAWQGILPYDGANGLIAALVGQLAELLQALKHWRHALSEARTLEAWRPLCQQLLHDFFCVDHETEALLLIIEQTWQQIIVHGVNVYYQQEVTLAVLYD